VQLHVPESTGRPGHPTYFSHVSVSAVGEVPRPAVDFKPAHTGAMAW
jgi:2-oxoisovalerate dehydrogenase E1 component alpha subunit